MSEFNPTPSEDYATLRRQFSGLVSIVRSKEAQSIVDHENMEKLKKEVSLSNKEAIESLRATNEQLTNINESLESKLASALAANQVMREALKFYADGGHWDYNDRLTNEVYLNDKGERATEALAIKPEDVELVEVGKVKEVGGSLFACQYSPNNGVKVGDILLTIKTKGQNNG